MAVVKQVLKHNISNYSTLWISGDEQWQNPQWAAFLEAIALIAIMFSAVVGNSLVVAVVYRKKELRNVTSIFIINLSISDIAVAVLCMPFSIVTAITDDWRFGQQFCQINGFLNVFFLLNSILTLTAISIQKYFAIVMPLREAVTARRAIYAIVWTWCQSFITALTPVLGWNSYVHIPGRMQCSVKVPTNALEKINSFFIIVTGFVIPLGVMNFAYFNIFVNVRRHTRRLRKHVAPDEALKSERNVTITLVIILALFLLCWAPFSVLVTFASLNKKKVLPEYFHIIAYWMGFLSSAVNPIVFALRTKSFRRGYLEIIYGLCGCCCRRKRELFRAKINTVRSFSDKRGSRRSVAVAWANCDVLAPKQQTQAVSRQQEQRQCFAESRPYILSAIDENTEKEYGAKNPHEIMPEKSVVTTEGLDSERLSKRNTSSYYFSEEKSFSNLNQTREIITPRTQKRLLLSEIHNMQNQKKHISDSATKADFQLETENTNLQTHTDQIVYNSTNCSLCHSHDSEQSKTDKKLISEKVISMEREYCDNIANGKDVEQNHVNSSFQIEISAKTTDTENELLCSNSENGLTCSKVNQIDNEANNNTSLNLGLEPCPKNNLYCRKPSDIVQFVPDNVNENSCLTNSGLQSDRDA